MTDPVLAVCIRTHIQIPLSVDLLSHHAQKTTVFMGLSKEPRENLDKAKNEGNEVMLTA